MRSVDVRVPVVTGAASGMGLGMVRDFGHDVIFWTFTDPTLLRHVQEQVDLMVTDRSLTRLRMF